MPWCPKCKNEYREGVTTCADCKIALVDSLEDDNMEIVPFELAEMKHKDAVERLVKYLRYSGIDYVDVKPDLDTRTYQVFVDSSLKKEAVKHYHAFLLVEDQMKESQKLTGTAVESTETDAADEYETEVFVRSDLETESAAASVSESEGAMEDSEFQDLVDFDELPQEETEPSEETESTAASASSSSTYVKKEDAYKDNHSSGTMFLTFSALGFIFIGLNAAGIIPYINSLFSYIVMSALFAGFFLLGIYSLKHAKEVSKDIDAENKLTSEINSYLESLGDLTLLDEKDWNGLNDEILYFKRTSHLKELVNAKFGPQNEDYLECIIEEFYNENVK